MLTQNLSDELIRAFEIARAVAREFSHATFSPAHLLRGMMHNDVGLGALLASWDADVQFVADWAEYRIGKYPKSGRPVSEPAEDAHVMRLMEVADVIRLKLGENEITPFAVLVAMSRPDVVFTSNELKAFPFNEVYLLGKALDDLNHTEPGANHERISEPVASDSALAAFKNLARFCVDKTALARDGRIDSTIGRERETRMMIETLGRRSKPNVIITGEPGVGKTALVEGLANLIVTAAVPAHLLGAKLLQLDLGALIAGATYKGEVEDRLKNIIAEVKQQARVLLFIDEIHMLLDPQGGLPGLANLLKPELARGELTVIGATTNDEYRKYIERDEAFSRRFEVVKVEEPDDTRACRMIEKAVPYFERHHGLQLDSDAPMEVVQLAKRYIKDRRLPDAALDLIDRTMAARKLMIETTAMEIDFLRGELSDVRTSATGDTMKELVWIHQQVRDRISPILLGHIEDFSEVTTAGDVEIAGMMLTNLLDKLEAGARDHNLIVDKTDIAAVVAHKTGIPLGKIQASEQEKLMRLEALLRKRVVGQDAAIEIIANAIRQNRSGVGESGKPSSFFLLGPTGTGKTELAKAVAELLFNDQSALIRFDMSEYAEEHTVSLLKGSPPGYVGYEEGGLLVTKIRQQPFAVLLFDEVEKAHPKVYDLFLQILDEGRLHDTLDREGDFSNAILLFTSNIGSKFIVSEFEQQRTPRQADLITHMEAYFRPEFLGRLTGLTPFSPITQDVIRHIFKLQLKPLLKSLEKMGIQLTISEEAEHELAREGYNPQFGARPLRTVINNRLRQPLSQMIIAAEARKGSCVHLSVHNGEYSWQVAEAVHS